MDDFNYHDFTSAVDAAQPGRDTLAPPPNRWKSRLWGLLWLALLIGLLACPLGSVVALLPALK